MARHADHEQVNACLLCRLVRREVEVSVVHEDELTVTSMDIQPVVHGHMLVVPRLTLQISPTSI